MEFSARHAITQKTILWICSRSKMEKNNGKENKARKVIGKTSKTDFGSNCHVRCWHANRKWDYNNESTGNDDATLVQSAPREQKQPFIDTSTSSINDALPDEYWHIRISAHIIKPEFYKTVDLLISKYHCSKTQAIAAVIEIGRVLFGRSNWKFHTENQKLIDLDTVNSKHRAGQRCFELLALIGNPQLSYQRYSQLNKHHGLTGKP